MANGVKANWSIDRAGGRTAKVDIFTVVMDAPRKGEELHWIILDLDDTPVFFGSTSYSVVGRYQSQVRQAMHDAEQTVAGLWK